jgi:hypothetical protein
MSGAYIVNTSVEDMKSSLDCAYRGGTLNQGLLLDALKIAESRGEKTKALIIERFLKKLVKVQS